MREGSLHALGKSTRAAKFRALPMPRSRATSRSTNCFAQTFVFQGGIFCREVVRDFNKSDRRRPGISDVLDEDFDAKVARGTYASESEH